MALDKTFVWGVGRRKTAVARVRVKPGTGVFTVNERDVKEFFPVAHLLGEAVTLWQGLGGAVVLAAVIALARGDQPGSGAIRSR